jgi:hypothetical protein
MTGAVTFVVDLDAAGAPPAADSVRQLLALIEGLQAQDPDLDWRLSAVSMNSPLRAELEGFDSEGVAVPNPQAAAVAEAAFDMLDAINDNEPKAALSRLPEAKRKQLRSLLAPLKDQMGSLRIIVEGHGERVVRSTQAHRALILLATPARQRGPEYGSVEGYILSATTYYSSPALRVRTSLTDEEVLCVFAKEDAPVIGAEHTLAEVWAGQHVLVAGRIEFDKAGAPALMRADSLKVLPGRRITADEIAAIAAQGGEAPYPEDWGTPH